MKKINSIISGDYKRRVFFILPLLSVFAVWMSQTTGRDVAAINAEGLRNGSANLEVQKILLSDRIQRFFMNYQYDLKWRGKAMKFFDDLSEEDRKNPNPDQINDMQKGSTIYIRRIRAPLINIIAGIPNKEGKRPYQQLMKAVENTFVGKTKQGKTGKDPNGDQASNITRGQVEISSSVPSRITTLGEGFGEMFLGSNPNVYEYVINPNDELGRFLIKELKLETVATSVLFDDYRTVISKYFFESGSSNIMYHLFHEMSPIYKDVELKMKKNHKDQTGDVYLKKLRRSLALIALIDAIPYERDEEEEILDRILASTEAHQIYRIDPSNLESQYKLKALAQGILSAVREKGREVLNDGSKVFGNTFGSNRLQCRKGKLKSLPEKDIRSLEQELRPLDIVLEKTPNRLTDKFIPGHYGHVAIWAGTEEELKGISDLSVNETDSLDGYEINWTAWDELGRNYNFVIGNKYSDVMKHNVERFSEAHGFEKTDSYQKWLKNGHMMMEALRPGVQLNTLDHFMDIDDLVVLRPRLCANVAPPCLSEQEVFDALKNGFRQIGKDYDFDFDVHSDEKIVCSEYAIKVFQFESIDWETSKSVASMASISPDQVAFKADQLDNETRTKFQTEIFEPVILYYNGQQIENTAKDPDRILKAFQALTQLKYDEVAAMGYEVPDETGYIDFLKGECH